MAGTDDLFSPAADPVPERATVGSGVAGSRMYKNCLFLSHTEVRVSSVRHKRDLVEIVGCTPVVWFTVDTGVILVPFYLRNLKSLCVSFDLILLSFKI